MPEDGRDTGGLRSGRFSTAKDMSVGGFGRRRGAHGRHVFLLQGGLPDRPRDRVARVMSAAYGPTPHRGPNPADLPTRTIVLFKIPPGDRERPHLRPDGGALRHRHRHRPEGGTDANRQLPTRQTGGGGEAIRRERISFDYNYEAMGDGSFFDTANCGGSTGSGSDGRAAVTAIGSTRWSGTIPA